MPLDFTNIDFEDFKKPMPSTFDFEGSTPIAVPEPIQAKPGPSGIIKPAMQTAKGMLYGEGLPEGLGYLQKPLETAVDYWGKYFTTLDEEERLRAKHPNLMAMRYAAGSLLLPGVSEKFASPEEMKRFTNQPPELQRVELAGIAAGYALFGAAGHGAKALAIKAAERFPWLAQPIGKALKDSTWYNRLTNRERGLVVQGVDSMKQAGLKDAQILKTLKKQDVKAFEQYRAELIKERGGGVAQEAVQPQSVQPVEPIAPVPPPAVKPQPKTGIAQKFQAQVGAERKPSPLAVLAERETEIVQGRIDFEAGVETQKLTPEEALQAKVEKEAV